MAPKKKGRGHSSKSKKVAGSSSTAVPSPPPDDPAVISDSAGEAATPRRSSTAPTGHSPPTQETPLSPPASQEPPSPAIPPPSPSSRLRTLPAEAEPTTAGEVSTSHPSLRPDPSNSIAPTTSPSSSEEECSFAIPPPLPSSRLLAPVDDASLRSSGETSTSVPYLPRFAPSTRQRPTRGTSSSRRTSRRPSSPAANLPRPPPPPPPPPSHPPFPSHRPLPSLPPLPIPPCTALPRVTDQERDIFTLICCTAEDVFAARYHLKTTNVQEADSSSSPQTGPAHVANSTPSMTEAMNMIGELADARDETEVVNASVAAYVDLDTILHSFNATPLLITRMIEQARAGGSPRNPGGRGGSSSVSGVGPGGASSGAGPGGSSIA